MRTFLLWHRIDERIATPSTAGVAQRLSALLDPLLAAPATERQIETAAASVVFVEQPVRGWRAPLFEAKGERWAIAVDYPLGTTNLLGLARRLEEVPRELLETLAPPFAVIWGGSAGSAVHVQNDGLGQAQLFEFNDGRLLVLTNRISALGALGIQPEPVPEEWAVRCALGWFPLRLSGYRNVRFVEPGTRLSFEQDGVHRQVFDVLSGWVSPDPLGEKDCLELARSSLMCSIEAAAPLWQRPSVGLSGGWDTRAVVATLRALGLEFSARVRGAPGRPDVVVASELARTAGIELRVRSRAGLPPDDAAACRRSISRALRWQAGYMVTAKHKTFLAGRAALDGGVVNVMGQHGEIGRSYYARMIGAPQLPEREWEEGLLRALLAKMPPFIHTYLHERIVETIRAAYREADRYDLTGRRKLDFFYLHERTRRWASGSLSSQDGIVVAPFLNPDFIRAVFAFPNAMTLNPFHRHIVARNAPDWAEIPYAEEIAKRRSVQDRNPQDWRQPRGNHHYDSALYWTTVGAPIIEQALAEPGWWTELFDPASARRKWQEAPDELAIAYLLPEAMGQVA